MGFIGVLDFKSNNSASVLNVVNSLGVEAKLVKSREDVFLSDRLIMPGVGHIDSIVHEMDALGLRDAIVDFSTHGNYVLGICLGQHILGTVSEESPAANTLGILDFEVNKLPKSIDLSLRVPHVGWNSVNFKIDHPLFEGIPSGSDFYFSHSYAITTAGHFNMAETQHSVLFASVAGSGNVLSVQFHPEKSQRVGRQLLSNYCRL
jgi:glutamine amidotransferase